MSRARSNSFAVEWIDDNKSNDAEMLRFSGAALGPSPLFIDTVRATCLTFLVKAILIGSSKTLLILANNVDHDLTTSTTFGYNKTNS